MGPYLVDASLKFSQYLLDFVKTMRRLSGETDMNEQTKSFFADNHALVSELIRDYNAFVSEINQNIPRLSELINVDEFDQNRIHQRPYASSCLVHNFFIGPDCTVSIDTYINPTGWEITLFKRQQKAATALEKIRVGLVEKFGKRIEKRTNSDRFLLRTFSLNTPLEEIATYLKPRISLIVERIESLSEFSEQPSFAKE